ncbi:hypothetical protein HYDPIDRAFT_91237 [Hydnomerulius pinastri MD-312]|uniref:Uncharacterized protein n=1 Tax=Hydnomerulius pinastri MD-312 TaxID=994086 RepID=A0A0C9W094_9AGAM|nr:hypothetical protein HYDPIDRAFT_91237 [Hydnomerulius pinastri MD-312]
MKERCDKITAACHLIYEQHYVVHTPQVEVLLKEESLVPTKVCTHIVRTLHLLHEFGLSVWKALSELDRR